MDGRFLLLLACFLFSGFSALLYQTAWTREFAFVFGTSEIAVAAVLAGYMGGLALGSAVAARLAPRVRRPVLVYGALELGIALSALAIPLGMRALTAAYVALFSQDVPTEPGAIATVFRLGFSFLLMLVPTGLMGATLPLLARHAVRREDEIGPRIGTLYAINTAGAIGGTLCAAFWLLPAFGLRTTVYVGAASNALVFLAAAALARGVPAVEPFRDRGLHVVRRWVLPLMLLSGAVSFSYEVLWTRLLSQLLGGSLYAFATMLSSFLFGIAVGSALGGAAARSVRRAALGLALAEIGVGVFAVAAFVVADQLPGVSQALGAGWRAGPGANAPLAAIVLLPVALCLGATFPFAVRLVTPDPADTATATARVYAWNTVGAIVGAVATGFVLLPRLHFDGTAVLGATTSFAIAAAVAIAMRPRIPAVAGLAVVLVVVLALLPPDNPWRLLMSTPQGVGTPRGEIRFEAAGRSSTVLMLETPVGFRIRTNGLPEAGINKYTSTPSVGREARALGFLPILLRPDAERLLVVGLGGGVALEGVPPTVREVDVVELEPEVVTANRIAGSARAHDPLAEARVRVVENDARGALMLARRPYDVIVSQPSHPWTAGASHLYTREFFGLVRERLAPGGVMIQWIGMRFVDPPLLASLLAALIEVFPEVQVYRPKGPALLFAASDEPLDPAAAPAAIGASPDHFARNGILTAEDLAAALVLDTDGVRALAGDAPANSDDHNLLASGSARPGHTPLDVAGFSALVADLDPLAGLASRVDGPALVRALGVRRELARAQRVAAAQTGLDRELSLGWLEALRRDRDASAAHFAKALEVDPTSAEAHAALRVLGLPLPDGAEAPPLHRAVAEALTLEAEGDWDGVAVLEERLSAVEMGSPLFDTASRLRSSWRLETRDPARASEAIGLLDVRLALAYRPGVQIERARAAHLAGRTTEAWATLHAVVDLLPRAPGPLHQRVAAVARVLGDDPLRESLLRRLARPGAGPGAKAP